MLRTDAILSSLTISKPENLVREAKKKKERKKTNKPQTPKKRKMLFFPIQYFLFWESHLMPTSHFYLYTSNFTYYLPSSLAYIPVPMHIP